MISVSSARIVPHVSRFEKRPYEANNSKKFTCESKQDSDDSDNSSDERGSLKQENSNSPLVFTTSPKYTLDSIDYNFVNTFMYCPSSKYSSCFQNSTLSDCIILPEQENITEWLTSNLVDFYNEIALIFENCISYNSSVNIDNSIEIQSLIVLDRQISCLDAIDPTCKFNETFNELDGSLKTIRYIFSMIIRLYAVVYSKYGVLLESLKLLELLDLTAKRFIMFSLCYKLVPAKDILYFLVNYIKI